MPLTRAQFATAYPGIALLAVDDAAGVQRYLAGRGLLLGDETTRAVTRAGEGNMNCTLRVVTTRQRLIVKQARPWVEKYEHIAAPWDRSRVEAAFYRAAQGCPSVASRMPRLLAADPDARVLVLEDLGEQGDCTTLYAGTPLSAGDRASLVGYLQQLHRCRVPAGDRDLFANREMRALNHEHIFHYPLREANGLDLDATTPGLQAIADQMKSDGAYVDCVHALGERYLEDADCLVHGDFFPGSWLRSAGRVWIIDPEFCFLGAREFDAGVMLAHLRLAGQPDAHLQDTVAMLGEDYDAALAWQFAGVEIMRRLIGVAQLPLRATLDTKRAWLEDSKALVMRP